MVKVRGESEGEGEGESEGEGEGEGEGERIKDGVRFSTGVNGARPVCPDMTRCLGSDPLA